MSFFQGYFILGLKFCPLLCYFLQMPHFVQLNACRALQQSVLFMFFQLPNAPSRDFRLPASQSKESIISIGFNLKERELGHSKAEKAKVISDNSQQNQSYYFQGTSRKDTLELVLKIAVATSECLSFLCKITKQCKSKKSGEVRLKI